MEKGIRLPFRIDDENLALRAILEGTATDTGKRFFESLVKNLSLALGTYSAWVTEYLEETRQLRALAFWVDGKPAEAFLIGIDGTPCESVIETTGLIHHPDNVLDLYPHSSTLREFRAVSYMGIPLLDQNRKVLGNLAVLDRRSMPKEPRAMAILQIFADRASAELQRLQAEIKLKKSEEKYRRIVETTGEGFLLLDENFVIADVNDAFCRMAGYTHDDIIGRSPLDFAADDFKQFLMANRNDPFSDRLQDFEGALVSRRGRTTPVRIYANILKDDHDIAMGYMYFIIDISQQKRSLALAGEVQKSLLPQQSPRVKGFDIAGRTLSCDEIGGDYFDYLLEQQCSQPHLDIIVGDVTGHGVEAALLMTSARAVLRMKAQTSPCRPVSQIATEINRYLVRDVLDTGRFMTMFYLRIALNEGRIGWVRAGHPAAVVYSPAKDRFRELMGQGLALGLDPAYAYQENTAPGIAAGDIVAIGTDGIWETVDRVQEPYGKKRFYEVIRKNAALSAEEIMDAVYTDLKRFSLGTMQEDDITLVIVKSNRDRFGPIDYQI